MHDTTLPHFSASSTVAVVGLGKIGLPLAVQYALHGRHVIGCDVDPRVVATVNAGKSHVQGEPGLSEGVANMISKGLLSATFSTLAAVRQARVVVVIVPVIINAKHEVNFEAIDAATTAIGAGLQPGTLVIYETTVPVGVTSQHLVPLLEQTSQLKAGRDFFVAFSPERVSSGYIFRDLCIYPKIVGGIDKRSEAATVAFYQSVLDAPVITMASTEEAEFVKLIETTYRDVNIALANEYACYADVHGLDVTAAIAAANTQPYSHIHTPGVGVGGHCIPVYPYFLLTNREDDEQLHGPPPHERNREAILADTPSPSVQLPMLVLPHYARQINDAMAEYAVRRVERITGTLAHQSVLILGVSYRGDVHETAFTSAKLLQEALLRRGATVFVDDPLFSEAELCALGYVPLSASHRNKIVVIILQAGHHSYQSFDFRQFAHCRVVLDGRLALNREKIESLGMRYIAIGNGSAGGEAPCRGIGDVPQKPPFFIH